MNQAERVLEARKTDQDIGKKCKRAKVAWIEQQVEVAANDAKKRQR